MPKFELILSRFRMGAEHLKVQTFLHKIEQIETHPTVENLSSSFHFESVISSLSKDSVIWNDSKMTCYFSVKLLSFQMTESILTLSFQMPSLNKTNCKWRKLHASISHLEMTGICQTRNDMQMTGSRLSDASRITRMPAVPACLSDSHNLSLSLPRSLAN